MKLAVSTDKLVTTPAALGLECTKGGCIFGRDHDGIIGMAVELVMGAEISIRSALSVAVRAAARKGNVWSAKARIAFFH